MTLPPTARCFTCFMPRACSVSVAVRAHCFSKGYTEDILLPRNKKEGGLDLMVALGVVKPGRENAANPMLQKGA
ncbi:MAG: hypothetical protein ACM3WS_02210 [Bacillota bacterium]